MKYIHRIFGRIFIVGVLILIQVVWLLVLYSKLIGISHWIGIGIQVIGIIAIMFLIAQNYVNPATKLAWTVLMLVLPVLGVLAYLFLYTRKPIRPLRNKMLKMEQLFSPYLKQEEEVRRTIEKEDAAVLGQATYILSSATAPIFTNTKTQYYSSGEENFPALLESLEQAEHFIFMEYFILQEEGRMWDTILEVLKKKAAAGLDVRVMYDDIGSLTYLPYRYDKDLQEFGIQCEAFNHFKPLVSAAVNHRDHRKITVVDGYIGFTGGINLGDEYINEKNRYGYWKDTGIRLEGEAVWKLTEMFLTMWNSIRPTDTDVTKFMPTVYAKGEFKADGFVQPYGDSPLDDENVGENVYLNMIHGASRYLYIMNPYIVLDNEMMTALCLAAKRGIDVCLFTPGVTDSITVRFLADTYFSQLIEAGVKIYAFNRGFIHAKVFLCDDKVACVGTVNMDFRSLYLHFECGVFLYRSSCLTAIYQDMEETRKESRLLSLQDVTPGFFKQIFQMVLRLFAPLI